MFKFFLKYTKHAITWINIITRHDANLRNSATMTAVVDTNMSPARVRTWRMTRMSTAFCEHSRNKLMYFRAFALPAIEMLFVILSHRVEWPSMREHFKRPHSSSITQNSLVPWKCSLCYRYNNAADFLRFYNARNYESQMFKFYTTRFCRHKN